ncbi:MAG: glycosyltransferase [Planctomycetes bacterium]|nr:glycosyltransferase [Planctomycetota bacterium]
MNALLVFAAVIQVAIIFTWLWQHVEIQRIKSKRLFAARRSVNRNLPPVCVIIPARNEAGRIGECLRSIFQQDYDGLRVIVVDDRSDDGTSERARAAAAGDTRVSVQRIDELPAGWCGKSHALWRAAETAESPWLLFVDADGRLEPGGLAAMIQHAEKNRADLLSLWPRDASEGFWERLIVPLCGAMIVIWYGRAASGDDASTRAFANGQFLLIRREAYFKSGGHAAVREAIVEDIPLARRVKAAGWRVQSAIGANICSVRMYSSFREVVSGWTRIYIGVLTPLQIALSAVSILLGSLAPYVVLTFVLVVRDRVDSAWWRFFATLSVLHLTALMVTSVRFFSLAQCRLRYLWLYPLSCVAVLMILFSAWIRRIGRSTIQWRGTTYRISRSKIEP